MTSKSGKKTKAPILQDSFSEKERNNEFEKEQDLSKDKTTDISEVASVAELLTEIDNREDKLFLNRDSKETDSFSSYFSLLAKNPPISREEEDEIWEKLDEVNMKARELLARFPFVLREHILLIEQCTEPDYISSLFWESMLPEKYRAKPDALFPMLKKWKQELEEHWERMVASYKGKKQDREVIYAESFRLCMKYPVNQLKIQEWHQLACLHSNDPVRLDGDLFLTENPKENLDILKQLNDLFSQHDFLRERILNSNLRLVASLVRKVHCTPEQFPDLIQEGNIGLLKAMDRFDYKLGHRFSTYATWWIRHDIFMAIASQARVIHIPPHMFNTIAKIHRMEQTLLKRNGKEPTVAEIASALDMPTSRVHAIQAMALQPISLQMTFPNQNEDGATPEEFIKDDKFNNPEQELAAKFLSNGLQNAIKILTKREQTIIRLHYGLDGLKARSVKEISSIFSLSKERIRQIEQAAFKKLREPEIAKLFHDTQ